MKEYLQQNESRGSFMEKIHVREIPRSKKERIGIPTGLLNSERQEIFTGDFIRLRTKGYEGPLMWNRNYNCYGIFFGLWYLDKNPYNPDCYGKFWAVPSDNGMRMELIPIKK